MANGGILGKLNAVVNTAACVSAGTTAITSSANFTVTCGAT